MRKYLSTLLVASMLIASCSKDAEVIREKIVSQSRPILSGQGQPDNGKGEDGDYYLDLTNAKLYGPKKQGVWGEPSLDLKGLPGTNGITPTISEDDYWVVNNQRTNIKARGEKGDPGQKGQDGATPRIEDNGNWWVDNRDTGKPARGEKGDPGQKGQDGANGSKILAEDRAPQATDGVKGDYFIDKAAKIFYGPKTETGWPTTGISLVPGNAIATADYQLSPDGKTLEKWLNKKTRYIDMNADPKLSEVEKIANNAFDDINADYDLSTIIVGDKVTELGIFTFSKCTRLRRIELPDGLITIGKGAFDACFNLQYINIPETVTNLGEQAFTNCKKLKTITIPKGISSFGKRTFTGCTALKTLVLENPVGFEINKAGMQAAFQGVTLNVIYVPYGSADSYKSKNKSSYSNYESIIKSIVIQ